jgi:hypothetical protein
MGLVALRATDTVGTLEIRPTEATGRAGSLDFGHRYIELYAQNLRGQAARQGRCHGTGAVCTARVSHSLPTRH